MVFDDFRGIFRRNFPLEASAASCHVSCYIYLMCPGCWLDGEEEVSILQLLIFQNRRGGLFYFFHLKASKNGQEMIIPNF